MDNPSLSLPPITPQPLVPYEQEVTNTVLELRHLTTALSAFHSHYDDLKSHLDFISFSIDSLLGPNHQNLVPISHQTQISDKILVSDQSPISEETQISKKSTISPPEQTLISDQTLISEQTPISDQNLISDQILIADQPPILEKTQISPHEKNLISEKSSISPPEKTLSKNSSISPSEKTLISKKSAISPPENALISEQSEIVSLCKSMKGNRLRKYLLSHLSELEKLLEEVSEALKLCPNPTKLVLDCIGQFYLLGTDAYKKNPSLNRSRQAAVLMLEGLLLAGCDVSESEAKDLAETAAVAWRKRLIDESGSSKASEIDAKGLLLFIGCFGIPDEFKDNDVLDLVRASNGKEISGLLRRSNILIKKMKEIIEVKQKKNNDVEALDIAFAFRLEVRYSPGSILTAFLRNSKKSWDAARKLVEDSKLNPAFMLFKRQLADLKSLEKCLQEHKVDPSDLLSGWHPRKRMTKIERELAALEKKRDEKRKEKLLGKRKADQFEPSKKAKNKTLNGARLSQGPEQQNGATSVGGSILSVNKLPKSSPVLNINGPFLLPGVEPDILLPRPYRIEDALYNERFAGRGLAEPERFVGRSYIEPERFVGRSYAEPIIHGANGLLRPSPLSDPYSRYLKPPPAGISGIPVLSSKSDLYGFADAVLETEANGGFRASGSVSSVPSTHRPAYRY